MKLESLVIVDQNATVNTFPGLVHTARHTTKVGCTRSCWANPTLNSMLKSNNFIIISNSERRSYYEMI
jgi:hypothetical protein